MGLENLDGNEESGIIISSVERICSFFNEGDGRRAFAEGKSTN
jgi:hypothetical protein